MGAAEKRCKCTSDNAPIAQGKAAPEGERLHLVSQLEQTKLAKTVKWLLFSSVLILLPWRFKQLLGPSMESRKTFSLSHLTFNQSLNPLYFQPIPLGFIRPQGWLENQLNLMSVGLAGHELDFYRVVRDSPWLGGGTEYSGLNEGLPYWFNGLVPLAYGLDDPRLKEQTTNVLDYILDHQQADGWLGPEPYNRRDIWGRFPLCLGLMQLVGADPGQASRIVPAMHRFVSIMHQMLTYNDGFKEFWGRVRYPDMIIVLQWLYEYYPQGNEVMLLEAMLLLDQQGLHWKYYYDQDNFIFADLDTIRPPIHSGSFVFPYVHAVNAGQGLKSGAVLHRLKNDTSLLESTRNGVNWTLTYHGSPAGSIIGDERESGLAPNRGSELCTTVETMYSLSYLYQALGDRAFADQCERSAFNALPAAFTHDHWGHQYLTVTNQPFTCKLDDPNPFWNTGKQSIMYGIEPNYPCCTVNFPQGLPKFLSSSFVHFRSNGLVHALLSPARVTTKLPNGATVNLTCETAYPFGPNLYYEIVASEPFTLHLRIPAWVDWYEMSASSGRDKMPWSPDDPQEIHTSDTLVLDPNTGLLSIDLLQYSRVSLTLTTSVRTEPRDNDTVAIYYGALLYALDVGQETTHIKLNSSRIDTTSHAFPAKDAHDYNITNTKSWSVAIDPSTLVYHGPGAGPHSSTDDSNKNSLSASTISRPKQPELKIPIWDYEAPPNYITVKTCEILWNLDKGIPSAPPPKDQRICVEGTVRERMLRPYGSLKVHMAELPVMDLSGFD